VRYLRSENGVRSFCGPNPTQADAHVALIGRLRE
jgi:hypothetical protein